MSFKNYFKIFIKNNLTNVKFSVSCFRVRGVFQAPQAACGRSVARHSHPEDAFKIATCSVAISPSRLVTPTLSEKERHGVLFRFHLLYNNAHFFHVVFQEYEEPVYSYSTYPDRRFSSRYHNILKMSPPFASSEGVSASGDRYQSDDA